MKNNLREQAIIKMYFCILVAAARVKLLSSLLAGARIVVSVRVAVRLMAPAVAVAVSTL
jgi:hypothetical protein